MGAGVGGKGCVKLCLASVVHVFSGAVRKQKSSFFGFQEFSSLHEVYGLQVDEVLEEDNGV